MLNARVSVRPSSACAVPAVPTVKTRWALAGFALVALVVAPFVGRDLQRASHLGIAVTSAQPANPVLVVLDRGGGRAYAGPEDADQLRSGVVERNGYAYLDIPEFTGDAQEWQALLACVEGYYADFAVDISDRAPARGPYIRAMIGGPSLDFGFDESVHGIAPWSGRVLREAVAFVFQPDDWDPDHLCEVAAHEIGHALGLDHSRNCSDLMSYESCGPKAFVDEVAPCGEWEDRACSDGRRRQNSYADLMLRIGARPPEGRERWRNRDANVRGRVSDFLGQVRRYVRRALK